MTRGYRHTPVFHPEPAKVAFVQPYCLIWDKEGSVGFTSTHTLLVYRARLSLLALPEVRVRQKVKEV